MFPQLCFLLTTCLRDYKLKRRSSVVGMKRANTARLFYFVFINFSDLTFFWVHIFDLNVTPQQQHSKDKISKKILLFEHATIKGQPMQNNQSLIQKIMWRKKWFKLQWQTAQIVNLSKVFIPKSAKSSYALLSCFQFDWRT